MVGLFEMKTNFSSLYLFLIYPVPSFPLLETSGNLLVGSLKVVTVSTRSLFEPATPAFTGED